MTHESLSRAEPVLMSGTTALERLITTSPDDIKTILLALSEKNSPELALRGIYVLKSELFDKATKETLESCINILNESELRDTEKGMQLRDYLEKRLTKISIQLPKTRKDIDGPGTE